MCFNSYDFDFLEVVAMTLKKFIFNESLIHVSISESRYLSSSCKEDWSERDWKLRLLNCNQLTIRERKFSESTKRLNNETDEDDIYNNVYHLRHLNRNAYVDVTSLLEFVKSIVRKREFEVFNQLIRNLDDSMRMQFVVNLLCMTNKSTFNDFTFCISDCMKWLH